MDDLDDLDEIIRQALTAAINLGAVLFILVAAAAVIAGAVLFIACAVIALFRRTRGVPASRRLRLMAQLACSDVVRALPSRRTLAAQIAELLVSAGIASKRLFSKRWFKLSAGLILSLLIALTVCAWHFRIWGWDDLQVYMVMSRECHPVWEDLHFGRVYSGQDVEEVIAATKPLRVDRYGEFVQLNYQKGSFTGVTITAKNGRLASAYAWSCTWDRPFFDKLTEEDHKEFREAYETHWRSIQKKREEAKHGAAADLPRE